MTFLDPSSRVAGNAAVSAVEDDRAFTAGMLASPTPTVSSATACCDVFQRFLDVADMGAVAVVDDGLVVGLVDRGRLTTTFARPLMADLYARRPIRLLMMPDPLIVESSLTLTEVGQLIARDKRAALVSGFVVVENGAYVGIASALDLMIKSMEQADLRRRQLEEARAAAEAANRAKTAFLANASHEIRTPLNAIMGFAEILQQEMLGPLGSDLYREYAGDIVQSGQHLMELINDLLDLSKAEANKLEVLESIVDVPRVAAGCVRLMSERATRARVSIGSTVPPDLPPLRADERKLRQMLLNLLSNALKFTPPEGHVTVDARLDDDGGLRISVADTGIGMSAAELQTALEPWGQIDSAINRKAIGTGLGLPLTKRMIELHQGCLDMQSEPNVGTTMTLVFPADLVLAPVADADSAPVGWRGDGG